MPKQISPLTLTLMVAALASTTVGARATTQPGTTMDCEAVQAEKAEVEEIAETFRKWDAALRAGDVEAVTRLVTEDAEFWSSSQPPLEGREALKAAFEPLLSQYDMEQDFECRELIVSGSWAFVRGVENNRLSPKSGGDSVHQSQRAFWVLHRGEDGVWRFARGMTNRPPERRGDQPPGS